MWTERLPAAHVFLPGHRPQEATRSHRGGSKVNDNNLGRSTVHLGLAALLWHPAPTPLVPAAPPLPAFPSPHVSAPRRVCVFNVLAEAGRQSRGFVPGRPGERGTFRRWAEGRAGCWMTRECFRKRQDCVSDAPHGAWPAEGLKSMSRLLCGHHLPWGR